MTLLRGIAVARGWLSGALAELGAGADHFNRVEIDRVQGLFARQGLER